MEGTPLLQACTPWGRLPISHARRDVQHCIWVGNTQLVWPLGFELCQHGQDDELLAPNCPFLGGGRERVYWLDWELDHRHHCWTEFTLSRIYLSLSLDAADRGSWKAHLLPASPGDRVPVEEKDDFQLCLRVNILILRGERESFKSWGLGS